MEQGNNENKKFHFNIDYWDKPQIYDSITLFQIGDISCNGNNTIGSHIQRCYEITYIVSGKGWISSNEKIYTVKHGDIFINLPHQMHNWQADPDNPFRFLYMGFTFNRYPYEENPFSHIQKMLHRAEVLLIQDRFDIHIPFLQVQQEMFEVTEYSELMVRAYLQQIIIKTYRNFCPNWEKKYYPSQKLEGNQKIIHDIITYIDGNISNITELKQISKELSYSYSYLSHVFSEETGLTLQEYYTQKRIEKAVALLQDVNLSITRIAEQLQYQSIHSFSKAFKKVMGLSPAQYQLLHKGE